MGAAAPALLTRAESEVPATALGTAGRPVTSTPMAKADVDQVIELLRAAPQTAYCEWEDAALLRGHLAHSAELCRVVRDGSGRVVAALIAGSFGVRGSISHAVVAPDHRRGGLARVMAADALTAFRRRGVRRVALAVLDGNTAAAALWASAGFSPAHGERAYECDL